MSSWHEADQFWADCGRFIFRDEIYQAAPEEVGHIVSLLNLSPEMSVLDMPCGIGRHSLEFARRGFTVTGVDRTHGYLDQCRGAATRDKLNIELVQADMRDFARPDAFDLCTNLYTSFGYFEDQDEDRRVAANMLRSLKPGGRVVFEMAGKETVAKRFTAHEWHEEPDGTIVLEERCLSRDWTWIENRWLLIRGDQRSEIKFSHRIYGAAELKGLLEDAGFTDLHAYGSLAGIPYDQDAKRLVVVGTRPK